MKRYMPPIRVTRGPLPAQPLPRRRRGGTLRRWCLAALLGGLSPAAGAQEGEVLRTEVWGVLLDYQFAVLTQHGVRGAAGQVGSTCLILLDIQSFAADAARVTSHEVGHCLDQFVLGNTHNGFGREGCVWGAYFCDPAEGYAEAYSRAYLAKCGSLLTPLGLPVGDGICEPPDPRSVTPALATR